MFLKKPKLIRLSLIVEPKMIKIFKYWLCNGILYPKMTRASNFIERFLLVSNETKPLDSKLKITCFVSKSSFLTPILTKLYFFLNSGSFLTFDSSLMIHFGILVHFQILVHILTFNRFFFYFDPFWDIIQFWIMIHFRFMTHF